MVWFFVVLWIVWVIPAVIYIVWKRGDWYLFLFPPIVFSLVGWLISAFSEMIAMTVVAVIHIYLIISVIVRQKRR
jgi:hypothetical protein